MASSRHRDGSDSSTIDQGDCSSSKDIEATIEALGQRRFWIFDLDRPFLPDDAHSERRPSR